MLNVSGTVPEIFMFVRCVWCTDQAHGGFRDLLRFSCSWCLRVPGHLQPTSPPRACPPPLSVSQSGRGWLARPSRLFHPTTPPALATPTTITQATPTSICGGMEAGSTYITHHPKDTETPPTKASSPCPLLPTPHPGYDHHGNQPAMFLDRR